MQQPEGFPTNYEALKKSAPQEGIKQHTFRTRDGEGQAVNFQVSMAYELQNAIVQQSQMFSPDCNTPIQHV